MHVSSASAGHRRPARRASGRSPVRAPGRLAVVALAVGSVVAGLLAVSSPAQAAPVLLSQGKQATASSVEGPFVPGLAFDGIPDGSSRWASAWSDQQFVQVDLGSRATLLSQVALIWEAAYARTFRIDVSTDGVAWTPGRVVTGTPGTQTVAVGGSGRFVRMQGLTRATGYGYSLYEFRVFGTPGGTPGPTPGPTPPGPVPGPVAGGGDLGPNVKVFDPAMSAASIQAGVDSVFATQHTNQFGAQRYALLFKPGAYSTRVNLGFNTSVAGLGRNPDDVTVGPLDVNSDWFNNIATQNFWRSAENLRTVPVAGAGDAQPGSVRWQVAQAAPMRRVHVAGNLNLAAAASPNDASGGYIADSRIDGAVNSWSQQQWLTRDSQIGSWSNGVWNEVFSGVAGAPAATFPKPNPYTVLDTTPVTREKPYLFFENGQYQVFVPSLRSNSRGTSWAGGSTPGSAIPLSRFYVVKPGASVATINAAVAQGLNLLFTPGIYHVAATISIARANTVVLGIGYPTIIPDGGVVPMNVADVDGVKVAGLLFDAGPVNSPVLLRVGGTPSAVSHSGNPTSLQDVFFRIGGRTAGKASTSLLVNSNDVIVDHTWAWRADHGNAGTYGWGVNTADVGLIVNGDRVKAYGLFVEHYQKYEVVWNGNGGRTIMFQNEMPYDPPSQAAWRAGANGYAAYKVDPSVTSHTAAGMGSYCYFNVNPSIVADRSFEAPNRPGVTFRNLTTVSLNYQGRINHIINDQGAVTPAGTAASTLVSYP